jgi:hypothetical protein
LITLPRVLIRRLRLAFSRSLGVTKRSAAPAVQFLAGPDGLTIQSLERDVSIAYRQPGEFPAVTFAVPFEFLGGVEGTKDDPITLELAGNQLTARWTDAGIPQSARTDLVENIEFPPLPETMQSNPPELMDVLRDAVEVTDPESLRYALGCLRLRSEDGQIAATDGSQLLVQSGWQFPWEGELLAHATRAFGSPHIRSGESVDVGSSEDWVTFRIGPWTIHLRIEKEARFPDVDPHVAPLGSAVATLRLAEADAQFFSQAIKKLPAREEAYSPVTVDLNGQVAIRAKGEEGPATELVLTNSRCEGDPLRISTNRTFLERALRFGFRELHLIAPETPACCRDDRRAYVWALLEPEETTPADADTLRVESPADRAESVKPSPQQNRRRSSMSTSQPRSRSRANSRDNSRNGSAATSHPPAESDADLLDQAEQLKRSLREALSAANTLTTGLKRQRQKSKRLRSAVASLKDLEMIDA